LDEDFESKPIKKRGKTTIQQSTTIKISSQITNNYMTIPTSPEPYITRKLNNMDKAKILKKECDNWTRLYHKTLKELEAMINVQKQV